MLPPSLLVRGDGCEAKEHAVVRSMNILTGTYKESVRGVRSFAYSFDTFGRFEGKNGVFALRPAL